jgi:acetolactate synthase I/II/III large subunit
MLMGGTVRETLVDALVDLGIDTVFALMGAANQDLICDLVERAGIRVVHGYHEAAVVSMADGYTRFSGRSGCATVTAGPGLSNTATALAVAAHHRSPVLLLAGDIDVHQQDHPQQMDQHAFARLLCKGSTVRTEWDLERILVEACEVLQSSHPYVLNLPTNVQSRTLSDGSASQVLPAHHRRCPAPELLTNAVDLLISASRPAILAGRGAVIAAAGPVLHDLAEILGAPLATTLPAHGLFTGHPLNAGVGGALGDGRANRVLARCDVLLAVGTSLHPLAVPTLSEEARVIHVDTNEATLARGPADCLSVHGDAALSAQALYDCLRGRIVLPREVDRMLLAALTPEGGEQPSAYLDTEFTVDPRHALAELVRLLPPQSSIVIGGGHAALTACQILPAATPTRWTSVSTDFATIGQALPVAIGACWADPDRRVVHVTGDGELMMSFGELHTAVRYGLPLTVVVLNDTGYGQERHDLKGKGRPTGYADHPTPDFAAIARCMGAAGYRIDTPASLDQLQTALAHRNGLVLVDVRINPHYRSSAHETVSRAIAATATGPSNLDTADDQGS